MRLLTSFILALTLASPPAAVHAREGTESCQLPQSVVQLPGLPEASGLAVGRGTPLRLWTHNDSGEPVIFALDANGSVTGSVRVSGARVGDWEAIAVGPCGAGSCLFIADIGDNEANRDRITIYRVPEPRSGSGSAAVAETYHATYPDGRQDAEALLIAGDGRLHIVTKGETGPVAIYRFPAQLQSGTSMRLERVGAPLSAKANVESRVTDAAISPDGQWAVLRTRSALSFYRASDLLAGNWRVASRVDLTPLKEPQGEGVALGEGNLVFLAGEGGGKGQPGTFVRFTCARRP